MIRHAKINDDVTGIKYRYLECRCGYKVKEDGEELPRETDN